MDRLHRPRRDGLQPCNPCARSAWEQDHQPRSSRLPAVDQPDGQHIAWGSGDHELDTAPLDTESDNPVPGPRELRIKDEKNKIYHIAWSPDSKFVSFSRGPDGEGDLTKAGTFQAACEIIGVYAKEWNLFAVSAEKPRVIDLSTAGDAEVVQLTTNGCSNKEPAWFSAAPPASNSR